MGCICAWCFDLSACDPLSSAGWVIVPPRVAAQKGWRGGKKKKKRKPNFCSCLNLQIENEVSSRYHRLPWIRHDIFKVAFDKIYIVFLLGQIRKYFYDFFFVKTQLVGALYQKNCW